MQRTRNAEGFTILEVVVTTAVAGFILLGLFAMISSLNIVNDRARDLTLANALAEKKIEELRSIGFSGLTDGSYDFESEMPETLAKPRAANYTISAALDEATSSPLPNVKKIDLSVSYNDHGKTKKLDFTTYIGELGVGQY